MVAEQIPGCFDPIVELQENTRAGFLSHIWYDKHDGKKPTERIIEPLRLIDGANGLLIHAFQHQPVLGNRNFKPDRIIRVERSELELQETKRERNRFVTAEVVSFAKFHNLPEDASSKESDKRAEPSIQRSPWFERWFQDYASVIRDALLDLEIDDFEVACAEQERIRLSLKPDQVRAVHSYILAEELFALSGDAWLGDDEAEHLEKLIGCLSALGWPPSGWSK